MASAGWFYGQKLCSHLGNSDDRSSCCFPDERSHANDGLAFSTFVAGCSGSRFDHFHLPGCYANSGTNAGYHSKDGSHSIDLRPAVSLDAFSSNSVYERTFFKLSYLPWPLRTNPPPRYGKPVTGSEIKFFFRQ